MQSYLIDQNQNRSIENGESVPDRAVSDFRKMIEEKSGEEPEHDHRKPILYAMTACAAAALLVTVTQKYGDALPFPGKTKEQTVAVAGNVQGEKTQTAESAAEASAAEEGNTGENTSTPESTGTELETENESGSAAVSEEQNLSGTDPAGSGEQSTSGGEQTGAAENNTGTAQTDPAPGAEPSSAPGTASGSETAETAAQVWQEYTVQKGDSLSKISERYYGTMSRVKDICELNQIAVEDLIYAGQKIYLPK
jgi:nucleoid-associated protein YgaU